MEPFDGAWLSSAIILTSPLLLAGMGELISERAGVLNVGLEGMVLMGAFWGFWADWYFEDIWIGILFGALAGMALAALMALLSVQAKADQVVVGVGINLISVGLTGYAFREIFVGQEEIVLPRMGDVAIPLLSDIPGVGTAIFDQTPIVYLSFVLVPLTWFVLFRTTWGLSIRAVGEVPAAADTAGVPVKAKRWQALLLTGALAGIGGASLSVVQLGLFQQNISAGRGFLALAAVIFGRWRPAGVLAACLVFGATDALQLRLQASASIPRDLWLVAAILGALLAAAVILWHRLSLGRANFGPVVAGVVVSLAGAALFVAEPTWRLPSQLWLALPFVVTLLALAGLGGQTREPAALTRPYNRAIDA